MSFAQMWAERSGKRGACGVVQLREIERRQRDEFRTVANVALLKVDVHQ